MTVAGHQDAPGDTVDDGSRSSAAFWRKMPSRRDWDRAARGWSVAAKRRGRDLVVSSPTSRRSAVWTGGAPAAAAGVRHARPITSRALVRMVEIASTAAVEAPMYRSPGAAGGTTP